MARLLTSAVLLAMTLLVLLGSHAASARPPNNPAEIERYCDKDERGELLLKQCDVPEKSAAFIFVEFLLAIIFVGGWVWLWEEARRRRLNYLPDQKRDRSDD